MSLLRRVGIQFPTGPPLMPSCLGCARGLVTAPLWCPLILWAGMLGRRLHYDRVGMNWPVAYSTLSDPTLSGELGYCMTAQRGWKSRLPTWPLLVWLGLWSFQWHLLEWSISCFLSCEAITLPGLWLENNPFLGLLYMCSVAISPFQLQVWDIWAKKQKHRGTHHSFVP